MAEGFHARFQVMWPYWAGGYPDQQMALEAYYRHQSDLQTQLARTVVERLGSHFAIRDLSDRPFEPSGLELTLVVEGPPHVEIDSSQIESVVRELGAVIKAYFQLHMPEAQKGADAYDVDSEFWVQRGWLKKVGLPEAGSGPVRLLASPQEIAPTNERESQLTTLNDREVEELLAALAESI